MKQIFAFSLLFCLVFLNVPRSIVHDCEHDHLIENEHHSHNHDSNHSEEHGLASYETENESCFICEFDLDVFEIPTGKLESFAKFINSTLVDSEFDCTNQTDFTAYSHRGPPTA